MKRTQHRTESEEAKRNRLHAETRRENRELRRALARALREVEKLQGLQPLEDDAVPREPKAVKRDDRCPDCGGATTVLDLPIGQLRCCRICPWRKKDGRNRPAA